MNIRTDSAHFKGQFEDILDLTEIEAPVETTQLPDPGLKDNRSVALYWAARGFSTFIVRDWNDGDGIKPIKGWQDIATTDPDTINAWFDSYPDDAIPALACDKFIVLDVDQKKESDGELSLMKLGFPFIENMTPSWARTKSGGWHLFFAADERVMNWVGKIGKGLDCRVPKPRGDGRAKGYIIAPWAYYDGKRYTQHGKPLGSVPFPPFPESLIPVVPPRSRKEPVSQRDLTDAEYKWVVERRDKLRRDVRNAQEGKRNSTLNDAAFELGGYAAHDLSIDEEDTLKVLIEAALKCGLDKDEAESTATRSFNQGLEQPLEVQRSQKERIIEFKDSIPDLPKSYDKSYEATESGIGLEFVAQYGDKYRFDHHRGKWFKWDGSTWRQDDTGQARHQIEQIARKKAAVTSKDGEIRSLCKASTTGGSATLAANNPRVAITSTQWDADPWLMGTPDGTIDLRNGEIRAADPADLISKQTGATPIPLKEFGAGQSCPNWMRFIHDATGGDESLIRYLRQWAGYMLTGDTRAEELLFIHGPGGGGKSTFINTLGDALGDYATGVPSDTLTLKRHENHKTELARLQGARLAYCSELPEGARWHDNRIKELTGGDKVQAHFMRQDYFEFTPQLKLVIVGNNAPSFANVDKAIKRRFNVVAFNNIPKVKDERLKDKLRSELPAILSWAIEGALDWHENGFVKPEAVLAATHEYLDSQDHFARWLDEHVERGDGFRAATDDLFDSWRVFCHFETVEPGNKRTDFPVKLRDAGFMAMGANQKVKALDGKRKNAWLGLRLKTVKDDFEDLI